MEKGLYRTAAAGGVMNLQKIAATTVFNEKSMNYSATTDASLSAETVTASRRHHFLFEKSAKKRENRVSLRPLAISA